MDDPNIGGARRTTASLRSSAVMGLCFGLATLACGGVPPPLLPPSAVDEAPPAERRYSIRTRRPRRVGQRWRVRSIARNSLRQEVGDLPPRLIHTQIELGAVVQLLEVDPAGRPFRLEYTVESLTSESVFDEGSPEERATRLMLVSPGSVITVIRGAEPVLLVDGEVVPAALSTQLSFVLRTHADRTHEVFGTTEPRAVGEGWNLDVEAVRRFMGDAGRSEVEFAGQTRLVRRLDVDGEPCLELQSNMSLRSNATLAAGAVDPPDGAQITNSTAHILLARAFPIDLERYERWQRLKVTRTVEVDMGTVSGTTVSTRTVQTREVRRTFEPLADATRPATRGG